MKIAKNPDGTTTYTAKVIKGQLGDFATEWWTEEDYKKHEKYIEEIKADGTYGEEYEVDVTLKDNELFDGNLHKTPAPLESYRMIFLDLSK